MTDKPKMADQIRSLTERLQQIRGMHEQMVATARQFQEVAVFHGHPDVVALDDELDILYGGQL